VDLVHLTLNDLHYYNYGPSRPPHYLSSYLTKGIHTYKGKRTTKKVFNKNVCTKEDISSSDEDEVNDSEIGRVLFMVVDDFDK
jgi:hypothetical protein